MDQNTANSNPAPAPAPTPVVAQPAPAETPVIAQAPKTEKPKGKSKVGLIIGLIVAVLAVVGIVILIINLVGGGIGFVKNPIYETNAYFIHDKDDKYILFNKDGERISEEKFDDVDDFYNGMALVKKDGKYGVIKDNGSMSIDFDEYEDGIYSIGAGIYSVSTDIGEDGVVRQAINGQGKVIAEAESAFLSSAFIGSYNVPFIGVIGEDNHYDVYSAYGQRVLSIESRTEPVFSLIRQLNTEEEDYKLYASISYDKGFVVYDANKLTELVRLEEGIDATYKIRMASDEKHFYAIEANDDKDSDELKKIYIVDGKLIDLKAKCDLSKVNADSDGMVTCTKEGDDRGDYPFADDGSLMKYPSDYRLGRERAYYADLNHYIVYNDDDEAVAIYADGKVVKSYNEVYTTRIIDGVDNEHFYYIRTNKDDDNYTTIVAKTDGTEIFRFSGKYYYTINQVSKDRVIAYDSGCHYSYCGEQRESGYYLFDMEGKKLYGPVYSVYRLGDDYYKYQTASRYSSDEDPEYGIIDKDGKKVFSKEDYYDFSISDQGVIAARKQTDDGSIYVVLDKEFQPILEFTYDDVKFYDDYFVYTKEDGSREYYDINIKKIYSE